jgi:hypothetical protein
MTMQQRRLTIPELKPISRIATPSMPPPPQPKPLPKVAKPEPPPGPRAPGEKTATQIERARRRRKNRRAKLPQVSWPEIAAVQTLLAARYPAVFGTECRPLAIGCHHQIMAETGCDRRTLSVSLHYWVAQSAYLRAVAHGTHRHGLDGKPVAELTEAERTDALNRLRDRGQQL